MAETGELTFANRRWVTAGIMAGLLLAALEATAVTTAMPTIVTGLGGFEYYSWVFSVYLLTSTVTVPLWGKLSDIYGRRLFYLIGVSLFLIGSSLCGVARGMGELIAFRAIQGTGAGALVPLAMIIVGEIFTLEERARMQGYFSGVWGLASVAGPFVGGWFTEQVSWRWVFFLCLPFGGAAAIIVGMKFKDQRHHVNNREKVDYAGALLMTLTLTLFMLFLLAVGEIGWTSWQAILLAICTVALFIWFLIAEQRSAEPFMPLGLFRNSIFLSSSLTSAFSGVVHFTVLSFVPLLMQAVHGTEATKAASALTPFLLGWVVMTVVGGRLLLAVGYRATITSGGLFLVAGMLPFAWIEGGISHAVIYICVAVAGAGMGMTNVATLLAVQNAVPRRQMGLATSVNLFFRTGGAAVGIAILGTVLTLGMQSELRRQGGPPQALSNFDFSGHGQEGAAKVIDGSLIPALAASLHTVFLLGLASAALALASSFLMPGGKASEHAVPREPGVAELKAEETV